MIVALAAAGIVAFVAYLMRMLTAGGAIAATFVGAAAILGGRGWIVLLLLFFVSSSALSRWRSEERDRLVGDLPDKGSRRDAVQVMANGVVFALSAVLSTRFSPDVWQSIGAGAIAAATADTWSTEVGTVLGRRPRSVLTWRPVPPGTSGGVTIAGFVSALVAAMLAAIAASGMNFKTPMHAVVLGGVAGSLFDSLLGATVQERRWCTKCQRETERRLHCGTPTTHRGGIAGFDNDVVNLLGIIAGAAVTWTLS